MQGTLPLLVLACFAFSGVLGATAVGKSGPPVAPATYMTDIEAGLGSILPDGTVKLRYGVCESDELRLLGLHCELAHFMETDVHARPRSAWRIEGLKTFLAPHGRTRIRWRPLDGPPVEFELKNIGRALTQAGPAGWRIRQSRSNEYEIRTLDGRGWRYVDGLLVSAQHPALGELRFATTGALIRSVQRADASPGAPPLLEVTYDSSARPVALKLGASAAHTFQWGENGLLVSWRNSAGARIDATYRDGLLEKIIEANQPARSFTWSPNPGYERGDNRWPAPMHLSSDGESSYDYRLSARGFVIHRRQTLGGRETSTVFNPRRRRLEQRSHAGALIATFRGQGNGEGVQITGLARIENGEGELLEEYRYDDRGQVVAIKRKGEPERSLSYDETGRLMTLTQRQPP